MTGWRIGWMIVPPELVRPVERLQQNLYISVPTLSQIAAEAAFEGRAEMEESNTVTRKTAASSSKVCRAGLDYFCRRTVRFIFTRILPPDRRWL
jgi:aspartate/methionine/tyrosine aminotransferase